MKPKILWMIDGKGWGWDHRASYLEMLLPNYEHIKIYAGSKLSDEDYARLIATLKPDIVVCPHPAGFRFFEKFDNVISILSGPRPFQRIAVWLCDGVGWGFDNRATLLASLLKDYKHILLPPRNIGIENLKAGLAKIRPDVIVGTITAMKYLNTFENAVTTLDSSRALEGWKR